MLVEYLFNPDEIDSILYDYRFIRQKIGAPDQEGIPSESFPTLRKTGRELYRILTNRHYPHLRKLLYLLDLCLSEGWEQPTLIRTHSESQFESAVSELLVASYLLNLGFSISSFDSSKGQERVADISACKDNGLGCLAEVYCPRDWEGLELFLRILGCRYYTSTAPTTSFATFHRISSGTLTRKEICFILILGNFLITMRITDRDRN